MLKHYGVIRLLRRGILKGKFSTGYCSRLFRDFSTSSTHLQPPGNQDVSRTRNIGIIAHIDAGKTTTTERMLYYSGHTRRIGDVDEGSTVTDFLPAERARGITIQSAAITFSWPPTSQYNEKQHPASVISLEHDDLPLSAVPHNINLIDTPGHADFTFEVRRSLRVLDGAICILDGVAGVEAQTEQVWNQALEWKIPRIVYINKLDRDGAAFGKTVREIGLRLRGWPAVCQIPWFENGTGRFTGIADVVNLRGLLYEEGGDGRSIKQLSLEQLDSYEPRLAQEVRRARIALVELLSEHDDILVEKFLDADGDHLQLSSSDILHSIRRSLLQEHSTIIPVFAGASFRNIGVQPLLDAVNDLLPGPNERPDVDVKIGAISAKSSEITSSITKSHNQTAVHKSSAQTQSLTSAFGALKGCALVFKVVNDARKGVLVYIRVYSGVIERNSLLFNTNLQVSERATNLLQMYASESLPVPKIEAGQIGVIAGSKYARTGDTLISYRGNKANPPKPLEQLQLRPIVVPPPVFFAAIEPNSLREEKDMHEKLAQLLREDPSLHVSQDEDTGQTLLSGMGELHLEIARDRLVKDLKANASMGKIDIGYRETLNQPSDSITKTFDKDRADVRGKAGCTARVEPIEDQSDAQKDCFIWLQDGNVIEIRTPFLDEHGQRTDVNVISLPAHLTLQEIHRAFTNGALAALSRGPAYSYPMRNTRVELTLNPEEHIYGTDSTYSALTAAARIATIAALRDSFSRGGMGLMEPVMNVEISVDEANLGNVIQDLSSSRGGHIISLGDNDDGDVDNLTDNVKIDIRKVYAPPDPFETISHQISETSGKVQLQRTVKARVPLKEMVGYLKHLRSMTAGRGTFVMNIDRFEKVTGQREKLLLNELSGN